MEPAVAALRGVPCDRARRDELMADMPEPTLETIEQARERFRVGAVYH